MQNLKYFFFNSCQTLKLFIFRLKSQNFNVVSDFWIPRNQETHISTKITNVMLFGPQSPTVMWSAAGTLQLKKVKSVTYVSLYFSGLQVRKTTASYHDKLWNTGLRSLTFALKFSKDLAWYHRCEPRLNLTLLPVLQTCMKTVTFGLQEFVVPQNVGVKRACEMRKQNVSTIFISKDDQRNSYRNEK